MAIATVNQHLDEHLLSSEAREQGPAPPPAPFADRISAGSDHFNKPECLPEKRQRVSDCQAPSPPTDAGSGEEARALQRATASSSLPLTCLTSSSVPLEPSQPTAASTASGSKTAPALGDQWWVAASGIVATARFKGSARRWPLTANQLRSLGPFDLVHRALDPAAADRLLRDLLAQSSSWGQGRAGGLVASRRRHPG